MLEATSSGGTRTEMAGVSRRAALSAAGGGVASAVAAGVVLMRAHTSVGPIHGRAIATSFGSVSLRGSRLLLATAGVVQHEHGHAASGALVPSAVHGAWTDAVEVDVEVHNGLHSPMELSPGQFRVRVDDTGPTVSLYSADRDAGPVEPGSTTTMRIRYLVPPPDRGLSLEFADAGAVAPVRLGRLGPRSLAQVRS